MSLWSRLKNVIRPGFHDDEIREELDFHLEMDRRLGHESREARIRLGNPRRLEEEVSEMRSIPALETLWRDVRVSARSLAKSKTMTAAVVVTLALGIGATTVIFSVVNGVLLKPLPYPQQERLIAVAHVIRGGPAGSADFLHLTYSAQSETFQASGLWRPQAATTTGQGNPEQVPSVAVTSQVLPLLGIAPARGRLFTSADEKLGNPLTVVLAYGYWQRKFGGVESVLGQRLTIDGHEHEIIGVMPRNFRFLDQPAEMFRPVQFNLARISAGNFAYNGIARLKPGASLDRSIADMARMIPIAVDTFPLPDVRTTEQYKKDLEPAPKLLKDAVVGNVGDTLWVLMGTIGLVLLIACANVANLFLVRTEGRHRELAVRSALGAGGLRIASGLLMEALLLGVAGGLLGCAAADAGLRLLLANAPANLPRAAEIAMDGTVLAFAALITIGTALLFGLAPALRYATPRLSAGLHSGGRTMSLSRDGRRTRAGLVVSQVGLALVLLIACGLMLRTYQTLVNVDPGFRNPEALQLARIVMLQSQIPDVEKGAQSLRQILEAAGALPGVSSAAFSSSIPMDNSLTSSALWMEGNAREGEIPAQRGLKFISPQYFRTLGVPLLAGRDLEWVDYFDYRNVAIISANLATEVWGSPQGALGKHVRNHPRDPWRQIVGVAGDVHEYGVDKPATPTVYYPFFMKSFWTNPTLFWGLGSLLVRTPRAGSAALVQEMQRSVWAANSNIALAAHATMEEKYRSSLARTSFTLVLLTVAGLMALLLGIVGIYGVVSYAVSQRTREIGIRLALGASPGGVRRLFTGQALRLVAVGTVLGLAASFVFTRLMGSLLFGVSPWDPATFLLVPALLVAIAMAASYLPARRALRVAPSEALREE